MDIDMIETILVTDCGSTTSKARFFQKIKGEYRFLVAGEAPTTVEAPFEDITVGVTNAIREIEELIDRKILGNNGVITPSKNDEGVDIYCTTSSAGGGLQMTVSGVVKYMTAESAERAALGAGAIVMDVLSVDDGRKAHEKINRLRFLRPDMILIAGGTDGGTIGLVSEISEIVASAQPKARLGEEFDLPIIYAGNKDAHSIIEKLFSEEYELTIVDNIRPSLEIENTGPARNAIHQCFMEHVMSHAPGYDNLMKWTSIPIMPTPAGEGMMFQTVAKTYNANVIGVGLGGATTNIYSIYEERFVRTVSANLGMSYSISNVLKETGIDNIRKWIPFHIDEKDLINKLSNKMIRPTIIPQTTKSLLIEHAVAREALRLGFQHHKLLARPLRGLRQDKNIGDLFEQKLLKETYIDMMQIDWIAGTGGLLSHAPNRSQSALILIDGFEPEGVTKIGQDSVFMMPHLGVLSTVLPDAAMEIFEKDCLVRLGTCIAPRGQPKDVDEEDIVFTASVKLPNGVILDESLKLGSIKRIPLKENDKALIEIIPAKNFNIGAGLGRKLKTEAEGGGVGIILDARGRPVILPETDSARKEKLLSWFKELDAYPGEIFS